MVKIRIQNGEDERLLSATAGGSLLGLLRENGYAVTAPCGGNGKCGKCLVRLSDAAGAREVLACRTRLETDCTVTLQEAQGGVILAGTGDLSPAAGLHGLGAAVDLGTTTVALELFELESGKSRGLRAAWNAQRPYGADVITRAQFCMEHADGAETLQGVIRGQIRDLLAEFGTEPEALSSLVVAGNTIMQHLFVGLDPSPIALAPFTPRTLFDGEQAGPLFLSPCVAGYVGGDITAGLLAAGLDEKPGLSLFLDIGTNGEMALGGADGFLCCAVASGPAFEGAGIACGMAGTDGAVSHVRWTGERPEYDVIGGGAARGLCGSGLIDLAAALCEKRIIDATGLLLGPEEAPEEYAAFLGEDENGNGVFYLTEDRGVYLTAKDVRQLQLAKAAVAAGIRVLLKKSGVSLSEIGTLYLAGGFGNYMDVQSAAAIGMIPAELVEKTVPVGNASLSGARMALLDPALRARLRHIQAACRYLELSGDHDFNEEYPEQMFFYEEDEDIWN